MRHCAAFSLGSNRQTRQTNGFIEALNSFFQAGERKARGYTRSRHGCSGWPSLVDISIPPLPAGGEG